MRQVASLVCKSHIGRLCPMRRNEPPICESSVSGLVVKVAVDGEWIVGVRVIAHVRKWV